MTHWQQHFLKIWRSFEDFSLGYSLLSCRIQSWKIVVRYIQFLYWISNWFKEINTQSRSTPAIEIPTLLCWRSTDTGENWSYKITFVCSTPTPYIKINSGPCNEQNFQGQFFLLILFPHQSTSCYMIRPNFLFV